MSLILFPTIDFFLGLCQILLDSFELKSVNLYNLFKVTNLLEAVVSIIFYFDAMNLQLIVLILLFLIFLSDIFELFGNSFMNNQLFLKFLFLNFKLLHIINIGSHLLFQVLQLVTFLIKDWIGRLQVFITSCTRCPKQVDFFD